MPGVADHAFGIVHRGAKDLPNILRWLAEYHPKTEVRTTLLTARAQWRCASRC